MTPFLPAEWTAHEATWLVWPHNRDDWPGKMNAVKWAFAEMIKIISRHEKVWLLVEPGNKETSFARSGAKTDSVELIEIPTNRSWIRDSGPLFVTNSGGKKAVARFHFDAWSKYDDFAKDRLVPEKIADKLALDLYPVIIDGREIVLEGGAIDVNGAGSLIATEECLLDQAVQTRNPGFDRGQVEKMLESFLGATNVIWLGKGIEGDDTHGHVDDVCRFVNENTIVLAHEKDAGDVNYHALQENRERLEAARLQDGSKPEVVLLPMPGPLYFDGDRLPASYANFYILNDAVLVPTFNDPNDYKALGIMRELFPDRVVYGVHAVDLVLGLGSIHCLTMQEPAAQS